MGLLNTTERCFYGVTRFLSMLLTLALLVCAGIIGINWMALTATPPTPAEVTPPKIVAEDVLKAVVAKDGTASDANSAAYVRIRKAVAAFGAKYHVAGDDLPVDSIIETVQLSANAQDSAALSAAYANGAADLFEHALSDARVDAMVHKSEDDAHPADDEEKLDVDVEAISQVAEQLNSRYDAQFSTKLEAATPFAKEKSESREQSMLRLARVGGPLLLLLLVLQTLAVGRVDQSLRSLADKR